MNNLKGTSKLLKTSVHFLFTEFPFNKYWDICRKIAHLKVIVHDKWSDNLTYYDKPVKYNQEIGCFLVALECMFQ